MALAAVLLPLKTSIHIPSSPISCTNSKCALNRGSVTRRSAVFGATILTFFNSIANSNSISNPSPQIVIAEEDEFQQEESRTINIFQETSPSVVFIKDLEVLDSKKFNQVTLEEDENTRVEGTGSGFIWDKMGHIVTNYHVVTKLVTEAKGLQCCKVFLVDTDGNSFVKEGKLIGFDAAYDLAVLKVAVEGHNLKPALIGSSHDLRVGQSCFAIGNPYGYENTLTTGVVSGLGREIPSPSGRPIRGAIQTDASINSGNSGGPLIDSYGHVVGVNTATFTRKGTGISSGVNFAIPIDIVRQTIPYLIVYGTSVSDRVEKTPSLFINEGGNY